ncbi:MAG: hypothetical protein A2X12_01675 [Bacteroidetes bacterium GWE2_29_8]|nr:MAG: hypothetical protein A2X12_01675 [Bacteroidetes bacterium GWE2_29_8]OFY15359.1 MAG: hypothetical protein A2X02_02895 [Bacteroidetes bacterium GWF2_29_10]
MTITTIILLIVLGLGLILLELLVIPGTTFVGVIGVVFLLSGIISSYKSFGILTGNIIFGGIVLMIVLLILYSIKGKKWEKFILKDIINNEKDNRYEDLKIDDKGVTISRLNPVGKALINNDIFEVQSIDGFIDQETEIIIYKLKDNKIIVKQIKT